MFFCKFCKILWTPFFIEHFWWLLEHFLQLLALLSYNIPFFQLRRISDGYFLVLAYFHIHSTRLFGIAVNFSVFPGLIVLVNGLSSLKITENQEMSFVDFPGRISLQKENKTYEHQFLGAIFFTKL